MSTLFPLRLSLQVAVCATLAAILIGVPIAYILARRRFVGRDFFDLIVTLPMVLPPTVIGYFLVLIIGKNGLLGKLTAALTGEPRGLMFTWYAAVIASFVVSVPFLIKTARAAMESVDRDLIDASHTLGRSELYTFFRVVIPLSLRGIIAGTTLAFARAMGEFGATMMVAGNQPGKTTTMPLVIYNETIYGEWGKALWMVLAFIGMAAVIIYFSNRLASKQVKR